MIKYVLKRLLALIPVILGVIFIIQFILYISPNDPAVVILGNNYTAEGAQAVRESLGLNDPFLVQFVRYVLNLLQGDFGNSYITGEPVVTQLMARFPNTLILVLVSMALCTVLSLPIGIQSAVKPNSWFSNITAALGMIGIALPTFWLGLMLIIIFALKLGLLPSGGKSGFSSIILPAVTVGFGLAALGDHSRFRFGVQFFGLGFGLGFFDGLNFGGLCPQLGFALGGFGGLHHGFLQLGGLALGALLGQLDVLLLSGDLHLNLGLGHFFGALLAQHAGVHLGGGDVLGGDVFVDLIGCVGLGALGLLLFRFYQILP